MQTIDQARKAGKEEEFTSSRIQAQNKVLEKVLDQDQLRVNRDTMFDIADMFKDMMGRKSSPIVKTQQEKDQVRRYQQS